MDQAHAKIKVREPPRARRGRGLASERSGPEPGGTLPAQARFLLSLQEKAGNRAVAGLLHRSRNGSGDAGLLQAGLAAVQREAVEEEPLQGRLAPAQLQVGVDEEELQMKTATPAPAQLQPKSPRRRNETGLPDNLKAGVESLSGISLDNVKVHYNSAQPAQLNALAYAQGRDIHLAPGQERHLPHEAWHVVQQTQGRVEPTLQVSDGVPVNDDKRLEREADAMGAKASGMMHLGAPSPLVQARRDPLRPDPKQKLVGGSGHSRSSNELGPARQRSHRVIADEHTPVQRVLSHSTPIVTAEVDACERLAAKVWKLTRANGESVIIKMEVMMNQTADEFEERAQQTIHLANLVLQGVPGMTPISPADIAAINGIDATAQGKADAASLQQELANLQGIAVFKSQTVDVGNNLRAMVDKANLDLQSRKGNRGLNSVQALATAVMTPQMMTSMGRMAAFDLIVNNYDRFRTDGKVNLTNVDIRGGAALGIDNLNPNDRLLDPTSAGVDRWEARPIFHDEASARTYAVLVVDFLAETTACAHPNVGNLQDDFLQGFMAAAQQMRAGATVMGRRRNDMTLPLAKRQVAKFIFDRLNYIPF